MAMEKYLKPTVEKETRSEFEVFDIETNSWTDFEMAGAYNGREYRFFENVLDLCEYILEKPRKKRLKIFYAHFGGKFDFLFILDVLKEKKIPFKLVSAGSKIISVSIKVTDRRSIKLVDSSAILNMSLKKLSEGFGVTRKLSGAIDFEKERVDKNNPLHREYLKIDCISLYESLEKFFSLDFIKKCPHKITMSSYAMHLWRQTLKTPIKVTDQNIQDFCRESYYGGRVEIFKQSGFNLKLYDVNSLYPTIMRKYPIPLEKIRKSRDVFDFGFHKVTIEVPNNYMPVLPYKARVSREKKLIFPTGILTGTWFSEELKLAIQEGARVLKHHEGYEFSQEHDLFTDYINKLYRIRLENPGKNALNITAKLAMNGLYGKFGQREERESLFFDPDNFVCAFRNDETFERTGIQVQKTKHRAAFQLVHIASAITSWCRIHMAKNYYLPFQDSIWYTDTDSVFTSLAFKTGDSLGDLKFEGSPDFAFFLLPKAYYLQNFKDDSGQSKNINLIKLKGFPEKALENITLDNFKNKDLKYQKIGISSLKKSLISSKSFLSRNNFNREIKSDYNKRVLLPNGDTRPWEVTKEGLLK